MPLYRQLMDAVRSEIASGRAPVGSLLPSVRQVARELEINPMTVSKAWSLLEAEGSVERVRGQGMRVCTPRPAGSLEQRQRELKPLADQLVARAYQLGLDRKQVHAVIDPVLEEMDDA